MAGWTIYHDQWINPTYFFWYISTRSTTTLHDTVDAVDQNIWPRFKIHDTSVSSMLLSFLASRICRAIRSAIFLRMLASWHVADPANPRVARCSMYICLRCTWHILIYLYIYIYTYLHMNIYDHIWRIYVVYEYRIQGGCFHNKNNQGKNKKTHHKILIFQGPWVWDAHHHPMKRGWLIYNHVVQHDTGI